MVGMSSRSVARLDSKRKLRDFPKAARGVKSPQAQLWPVLVPFGALVARRCLARAMRSFPQYWVLVTASYFGALFAVGVAYPLSTGETVLRTAFDAVTKPS